MNPKKNAKPPFATGRKVLVLSLAAWGFVGLCIAASLMGRCIPENVVLVEAGWTLICLLAGLVLFIRAAWRKRVDASLVAGGALLLGILLLAGGALSQRIDDSRCGYTSTCGDARNAYTAAQAYFQDLPDPPPAMDPEPSPPETR